MHKLNLSVIAGLALALASTGALAQKKQPTPAPTPAPAPSSSGSSIGQGDMELGFFGNLRDDGTTTSLTLGAAVGSYLSDNLELRVTPTIAFIDGGGVSATLFSP